VAHCAGLLNHCTWCTTEAENTWEANGWENVGFELIWTTMRSGADVICAIGYTSVACVRARNAMQCIAKLMHIAGSRAGILYYSIHTSLCFHGHHTGRGKELR